MIKISLPFSSDSPGSSSSPFVPIEILNPQSGKRLRSYALIDTGAEECALPASFAAILGHQLGAGSTRKIGTGNGVTVAYGHTTRIQVAGFSTGDVLVDYMPNLGTPLLGVKSFLSHFVLIVDYPAQSFSLTANP